MNETKNIELIKLYCSDANIMPKLLITDFLPYLGFFIEEINEIDNEELDNVIEIYLIDESNIENIQIDNYSKEKYRKIYILSDGYTIGDTRPLNNVIEYDRNEKKFLEQLIAGIKNVFKSIFLHGEKYFNMNLVDWEESAKMIAKEYLSCNALAFHQFYKFMVVDYPELSAFAKALQKLPQTKVVQHAKVYENLQIAVLCGNLRYCFLRVMDDASLNEILRDFFSSCGETDSFKLFKLSLEEQELWTLAIHEKGMEVIPFSSASYMTSLNNFVKFFNEFRTQKVLNHANKIYAEHYSLGPKALPTINLSLEYNNKNIWSHVYCGKINMEWGDFDTARQEFETTTNLLLQKCTQDSWTLADYELLKTFFEYCIIYSSSRGYRELLYYFYNQFMTLIQDYPNITYYNLIYPTISAQEKEKIKTYQKEIFEKGKSVIC